MGLPILWITKNMLIRKARTRFTYVECINDMWKEQLAGQMLRLCPHGTALSTTVWSKGEFSDFTCFLADFGYNARLMCSI